MLITLMIKVLLPPPPIVKKTVFKLFDCIRRDASTDDYTLIPALLLIGRHPAYQSVLAAWADKPETMQPAEFVGLLEQLGPEHEVELLREYALVLSRFTRSALRCLRLVLAELHLFTLTQEAFEAVFDYALQEGLQAMGRGAGQWQVPNELAQLAVSIYPIESGSRIFNPNAGTAALVSCLGSDVEYTGKEVNVSAVNLARLRLWAHQMERSQLLLGDSDAQWPKDVQWPFICSLSPIVNPRRIMPTGASARPNSASLLPSDAVIIHQSLRHLSENGRAVIAVFPGFLWRADTFYFRHQLIRQDWLEAVIELPAGVLAPATAVPLVLLAFNRAKARPGHVLFVDAEPHTSRVGRRRVIDVAGLRHTLHQPQDAPNARYADHDQIQDKDFILIPKRYTEREIAPENGALLGAIAVPVERQFRAVPGKELGRTLSIRDLKKDNLHYVLDVNALASVELTPRGANHLPSGVLLVALRGNHLKPTWYVSPLPEQDRLVVSTAVAALQLDAKAVDLAYLVCELNSDYVTKQLKAFQYGITIPNLSVKDLLKLHIRLPALAEQRAVVAGQRDAMKMVEQLQQDLSRSDQSRKSTVYTQFASFKHAFVQPLANLQAGIGLLQDYLREQAAAGVPVDFAALLSQRSQRTLQDLFASFNRDFGSIRGLLERRESELRVEDYALGVVDVVAYLTDLVEHKQNHALNFEIVLDAAPEIKEELGNKLEINSNAELMDILFGYIISNAERHGFKNRPALGNKVLIEISIASASEKRQVNVVISNSGVPFPQGFTKEKYMRLGYSSGDMKSSGRGGSEVTTIVAHLGGDFDVLENVKPGFPVGISLYLPLLDSIDTPDDENV